MIVITGLVMCLHVPPIHVRLPLRHDMYSYNAFFFYMSFFGDFGAWWPSINIDSGRNRKGVT